MALAAAVHASVLSRISVFDRGVRHARFHVCETSDSRRSAEEAFLAIPWRPADCDRAIPEQMGIAIAQAVQIDAAINFDRRQLLAIASKTLPAHSRPITEISRMRFRRDRAIRTNHPSPFVAANKPASKRRS